MISQPYLFDRNELNALVHVYSQEAFRKYPMLELFGAARAITSIKMLQTLIYENLEVFTDWTDKPAKPTPIDGVTSETRIYQSFFKYLYDVVPSEYEAAVRDLSAISLDRASLPTMIVDQLQTTEDKVSASIQRMVDQIWRSFHQLIVNLLNTQNFGSLTVNGASETITNPFGLGGITDAAASWATAGTQIHAELEKWDNDFVLQAGVRPNLRIVSPRFWEKFVAPNTFLKEFMIRNPEFNNSAVSYVNMEGVTPRTDRPRIIVCDAIKNDGSNNVYQWTDDIMVSAYHNPGDVSPTFAHYTVRTADNDMQGGISTVQYKMPTPPMDTQVHVTFNGVPVIQNPKHVQIYNLIP